MIGASGMSRFPLRIAAVAVAALLIAGCGDTVGGGAELDAPAEATPQTAEGCWDEDSVALTEVVTQQADGSDIAMRKSYDKAPEMVIDPAKTYTATLQTNKGTIEVEFLPGEAPNTVNNFVCLARDGYYDGTPFHRVVKGFMIQGGDPTGTGTGGPGYRFNDEKVVRPYNKGIMAMANAGPNTNGSQFFIMLEDYPLPPNYTIFGQVKSGQDVVDAIGNTQTGPSRSGERSLPMEPLVVEKVTISES